MLSEELCVVGSIGEVEVTRLIDQIKERLGDQLGYSHTPTNSPQIHLSVIGCSGDIGLAVGFYSWIKYNRVDLVTVGMGELDSAALVVLLAGQERYCFRGTRFVLYGPSFTFGSKTTFHVAELEEKLQVLEAQQSLLLGILKSEKSLSSKDLFPLETRGLNFSDEEAVKKGIVQSIVE